MRYYLEEKCDNAGIFKELTDEEVEVRLKAEEQNPLSLIKNLISGKHTGVNDDLSLRAQAKQSSLFSGVNITSNQSEESQPLAASFAPSIGGIEEEPEIVSPEEVTPVENKQKAVQTIVVEDLAEEQTVPVASEKH